MGFRVFYGWRSWGSRCFTGGEVTAFPQPHRGGMQGWWAEMGRAAGCSCSSCRSSSLWDLGNLVTSGSLRVAQLCPAWEKEMENLCTEQEGKAGAAVGRPGLPVFPLLAEEGGKPQHLGKKKRGKSKLQLFLLLLPWPGVPSPLC